MQLTSSVFENEGAIPQKYTCEGEAVQPPLEISDVPSAAKSLALIVDDPDAPVGLFTHWVVWNIEPTLHEIEESVTWENALEGTNSAGNLGWTAPCPPEGTGVHHYRFHLFALDSLLDVKEGAEREEVEEQIAKHEIAKAELVGMYQHNEMDFSEEN